jgi:hypothetical protein
MKSFAGSHQRSHGCVVGYLRAYIRWDGSPGLTFDEQRALVREVGRERGYGRGTSYRYVTELDEALGMAADAIETDRDLLVVIPTLDGLQFNLRFLERLASCRDRPVYVRSGWRRPKKWAEGTNYEERAQSLGWLLMDRLEANDFAGIVERVRQRNRALPRSIADGLKEALARGVAFGSKRNHAHHFTKAERCGGGRVTAKLRREAAKAWYRPWLSDICRWRAKGDSLAQIANKLARRHAQTREGAKIGPMQICRILQREAAVP